MHTLPSGVAVSGLTVSSSVFVSTSFGYVGAVQLNPRGGPAGSYRTIASIAGDAITWGAWAPVPNNSSIQASANQVRCTAATLQGSVSGVSLTSAVGQLAAVVTTANLGGGSPINISSLVYSARSASTTEIVTKVAACYVGWSCTLDYDYVLSNYSALPTDGDADILTVIGWNLASVAGTRVTCSFLINWECSVLDRATTILASAPAVIDQIDLQRGLRNLSSHGQCFILDDFDLGTSGIGMLTAVASYPGMVGSTPTITTESTSQGLPSHSTSTSNFSRENAISMLDQAANASGSLRTIIENTASAAATLAVGAAMARSQVPRLE